MTRRDQSDLMAFEVEQIVIMLRPYLDETTPLRR
jgi:hypothetical protein